MTEKLDFLTWKWDRNYLAECHRLFRASVRTLKMPSAKRGSGQLNLGPMAAPGLSHRGERKALVGQVYRERSHLWSGSTDHWICHPKRCQRDNAPKETRDQQATGGCTSSQGSQGCAPGIFSSPSILLPGSSLSLPLRLQLLLIYLQFPM